MEGRERASGVSEDQPIFGGAADSAAKARAKSLIGRTLLGRYHIEELVAMGGLAAVFRATKLATGGDVAIKVLHPDIEGLPELVERFEREAVAGKHILHPNVVAVFEIDQLEDKSWFLVQEFVRGKTLRHHIDQGPIAPLRAARFARQLAEALTAAHDIGIVHRDLKPLNVMVLDGPEEQVQLIDFGLAKVPIERMVIAEEGRRSLTQAGVVFGTIAYLAPEAALGMRSIERRSDLYALGLILYEMLAGKHPFTATEPTELFRQQRNAVPPPIAERSPGISVPPELEAIAQKLLEKDPDARHPHARAVIVALDGVIRDLEEREALARHDAASPLGAPLLDRARSSPLLAAVAIAAVIIVGTLAWLLLDR